MPGRSSASEAYRYGFQNQETDKEIWGGSSFYTFRMNDPRIGRFFATDPLEAKYPYLTPYQFSSNQPIHAAELEGLESGEPLNFEEQQAAGLPDRGSIEGACSLSCDASGPFDEGSMYYWHEGSKVQHYESYEKDGKTYHRGYTTGAEAGWYSSSDYYNLVTDMGIEMWTNMGLTDRGEGGQTNRYNFREGEAKNPIFWAIIDNSMEITYKGNPIGGRINYYEGTGERFQTASQGAESVVVEDLLLVGTLSALRWGIRGYRALRVNSSALAMAWQGKGTYPGVDAWRNIMLKDGTYVVGGLPGQSNYYTTMSALTRSGMSKSKLFQGLQVAAHPQFGYRGQVGIYRVSGRTPAAFGTTYANPQFGAGGLPQLFLPNYSKLELVKTIPLK